MKYSTAGRRIPAARSSTLSPAKNLATTPLDFLGLGFSMLVI